MSSNKRFDKMKTTKTGELIKKALEQKGWSNVDLAEAIMVSRSAMTVFLNDTMPIYRSVEIYEVLKNEIPFDLFIQSLADDYKEHLKQFFLEKLKKETEQVAVKQDKDQYSF